MRQNSRWLISKNCIKKLFEKVEVQGSFQIIRGSTSLLCQTDLFIVGVFAKT